jgi:hypothetical protein
MMASLALEAEYLAREMKGRYLTASIRQKPADAYGSEFHLVEAPAALALGINFRIRREERQGSEALQRWPGLIEQNTAKPTGTAQ